MSETKNRYQKYEKTWYPAQATQAAFLLGGIGTGNVSVGSRGQLMDWELFNRPAKGMRLPYSFFAIWTRRGQEEPMARVLEAQLQPPYTQALGHLSQDVGGLPRLRHSEMAAEYPFTQVRFGDEDLPVGVEMEAFTPFVPLDAEASGLPCAIVRYRVKNPGDKTVVVSVAGSLCNATEYRGYNLHRGIQLGNNVKNEYREEGGSRGLYFSNPDSDNAARKQNSMALTTAQDGATYKTAWINEGWFDGIQDFWDEFASQGKLSDCRRKPKENSHIGIETHKVGSLCLARELAPQAETVFEFLLTWYFPLRPRAWDCEDTIEIGNSVRNDYATRFANAWEVQAHVWKNLPTLEGRSRDFQRAMYTSSLPDCVMKSVVNNITVMRSPTCFRIENGDFLAWEGCNLMEGSCSGTCTHVWNYAQTVAFLFPELEKSARRIELLLETEEDGEMRFRTHRALGLPAWRQLAAADGQPGVIVRAYREWKLTGDEAFLQEIYPKVLRATAFMRKRWDACGEGVMSGEQHNTYDIEFYGVTSMTNSLFYAALQAVVQMARAMGDSKTENAYSELIVRGTTRMDELLWNGEYYRQAIEDVDEHKYQYGEGCLSDQLVGEFLAHMAGLPRSLPQEHVVRALRAVFKYNFCHSFEKHHNAQRTFTFNDEQGLLICTWPHGGRPKLPFVYADEVWTGIEYQVAAHMIYEGLLDEGLTIVEAIQNRQDGVRRNPWNENECGNHYARSLASWGLLTALCGYHYDMTEGTVAFAPAIHADDFSCFFSTGTAWGIYRQTRGENGEYKRGLEVLYGDAESVRLKA